MIQKWEIERLPTPLNDQETPMYRLTSPIGRVVELNCADISRVGQRMYPTETVDQQRLMHVILAAAEEKIRTASVG